MGSVSHATTQTGAAPIAPQFWEFLSIYAYTLCRRTTKVDVVTHMGRELVFRSQTRPNPKGALSQRSPIFGVPFYLCVHLLSQTTKFDAITPARKGRVSLGQPRLPSQESGVSWLPNFWVFLYLCIHRLKQNDQIRHGNTYGEEHVFRRSAIVFAQMRRAVCRGQLNFLLQYILSICSQRMYLLKLLKFPISKLQNICQSLCHSCMGRIFVSRTKTWLMDFVFLFCTFFFLFLVVICAAFNCEIT